MKRFIKYILMGMLSAPVLSSCSDILDKAPLTEIGEDQLWGDPALIQAFVNSRYNQVGHGWTESMQSSIVDETELTWLRGCEVHNFARVSSSDLGRMNGAWWGWDNRSWSTKWNNIANCNIFFERIEDAPFTDADLKERLKGEVRFIRALEYNDLITRWGGVPLITESYTIDDVDKIKQQVRASYKDCVDFMVEELDQAAKELPASYSGDDYGRATSVAAKALKSRILLYAASDLMNVNVKMPEVGYTTPDPKRWEKAATAADEALTEALNNGYGLLKTSSTVTEDLSANYQNIFLDNTSTNTEVIFARMGTASNLGEGLSSLEQYNYPNGWNGWGGNCPLQELVDDYEIVKNGVASRFDWNNPDEAASPYENRDPRFYASILYDGAPWKERTVETYFDVDASGKEIGGVPDRGFLPHSGRSGIRFGVPLPQSGDLSRRHRDRRLAIGRDSRYAGRHRVGQAERCVRLWYLQRHRLVDRPSDELRHLHPCRTRDRRGFDQSLYGTGDGAHDAGADDRPRQGDHRSGVLAQDRQASARSARRAGRGASPERPDRRLLEDIHLCAQLHLSGTRVQLSHGAGRCAQTQGDLLHPRGGLPCRRNETRSDRPDRCRDADHRHRDAGSHLREDRQQHRGDQGPGRQGNHRNRQGRRAGTQEFGLLYRSARRGGVSDADRGIGAAAVAGVSYRCQ